MKGDSGTTTALSRSEGKAQVGCVRSLADSCFCKVCDSEGGSSMSIDVDFTGGKSWLLSGEAVGESILTRAASPVPVDRRFAACSTLSNRGGTLRLTLSRPGNIVATLLDGLCVSFGEVGLGWEVERSASERGVVGRSFG